MPQGPNVPPPTSTPEPTPPQKPEHHADHIPFLYGTDPLNPIFAPPILIDEDELNQLTGNPNPPSAIPSATADAIPDPEPSSPSLPSPDPGIFHPDPVKPRP